MRRHVRGDEEHAGAGRRAAPRIPVAIDCTLRWHSGEVEGSLLDLSTGGAAVSLNLGTPLPPDVPVVLDIETEDEVLSIDASVVSEDQDSFASVVVRLKFTKVDDELRALIEVCAATFRARQVSIFGGHI
jgi:hypothetical protein